MAGEGVDLDLGLVALAQVDHLVLADLDVDLHRRERGDDQQHVLAEVRAAQPLADLLELGGDDAVDGGIERAHRQQVRGLGEHRVRLCDPLLDRGDARALREDLRVGALELGGARALGLDELGDAVALGLQPHELDLLQLELGLGAGPGRLLLPDLGAVAARVDAGEELALLDLVALFDRELEQVLRW